MFIYTIFLFSIPLYQPRTVFRFECEPFPPVAYMPNTAVHVCINVTFNITNPRRTGFRLSRVTD